MSTLRALVFAVCMAANGAVSANAYDDLMQAAVTGDASTVAALVDRGLDVNSVDPRGETLLIIASRGGHAELVKALLGRKAKLEAVNVAGETALAVAAYNGHSDVLDLLLAKGADPVNHQGWSALHYAAMQGHGKVLQSLIARGAPVDALAPNGATALMLAARSSSIEAVRVLLRARADARLRGRDGETAVDWAVKAGNTDAAALIRAAMGQ
ncbi:MAG: ankyrin repeat domain-containing protein [Methyloversatilis sp.]|nr:ankyrin repeat domain-containing protein [Methyloversatilis sp.]MBP6193896.1 ankyrin repeat domain-containing protein [Methyloversatilis sp.]MBP9118488.1 ankyrin repeat domain-containing protein [Methyloversatilis sp.]